MLLETLQRENKGWSRGEAPCAGGRGRAAGGELLRMHIESAGSGSKSPETVWMPSKWPKGSIERDHAGRAAAAEGRLAGAEGVEEASALQADSGGDRFDFDEKNLGFSLGAVDYFVKPWGVKSCPALDRVHIVNGLGEKTDNSGD